MDLNRHKIEALIEKKRQQIDHIDKLIIKSIVRRTQVAKEIGQVKARAKDIIYRPDREKKVFLKIEKELNDIQSKKQSARERYANLAASDLINIYREIISIAKAYEGGIVVHYLGPEASFSHWAVQQSFGRSARITPQLSISAVFDSVSQAKNNYTFGLVPIDNTVEGSIGLTLDEMYETDLRIFAEKYIHIEQCLLGKRNVDYRRINKIYTVKIAYDQCRKWLMNHLRMVDVELVEVSSTSRAAQIVSKMRSNRVAAIASRFASQTYSLQILAENIQDVEHNITRFIEIGKHQCPPTGQDKTSIAFAMPDKPGQLAKILQIFSDDRINLTKVESRVNKNFLGSYVFFLDFLGHEQDENIQKILAKVYPLVHSLRVLGSYPSMNNLLPHR